MSNEDLKRAMRDAETKRIIKEAIREWLNEQFAKFGKWSFYGIISLATVAVLYTTLVANGWHKA